MAKLTTYALAGALAVALAPVAGHAADLPEPPLLEPAAPVEFASAWYIRGDVGYKNYNNPDARFTGRNYPGNPNFKGEKLGDAAVIGGGVGYKFNEHFRSDVTVDYETRAKFTGTLYSNTGACGAVQCGSRDVTKIDAWTLFWNGYVDLITIHGFTPYVGGGIGVARLDVKGGYDTKPIANCPGCKPDSYGGDAQWNFAWNLQAGASYQITDNLLFDANYRFVDLGEARTKTVPGKNGGKVRIDDVQAHEVRVGFRYMLD
ncbi:outer membrane protein [Chenggangzhangella methanolivorans]|uniref:outer membrane protein n=1 Tax=Chenggangzhangella methanolivorans TaxID=1437009 RepID=UPI00361F2847